MVELSGDMVVSVGAYLRGFLRSKPCPPIFRKPILAQISKKGHDSKRYPKKQKLMIRTSPTAYPGIF